MMTMTNIEIERTIHFVERHGYALLFFWVLAEQGALPIPSAPLLVAAGALARTGRLSAAGALACCVTAALLADSVWFYFGRHRGKRVLRFLCRFSISPDSCVGKTEGAFLKYGLNTLLVAKFVPGLNSVAAPLSGDSGIGVCRFLAVDMLGIALWSGTYIGVGYLFADQLELALSYMERLGSGLVMLVLGFFAGWILWKFIQRQRFLRQLKVARITPKELLYRVHAGEALYIVDLRSPLETEASTIPGAIRFSPEDLTAKSKEIPRDREIILFCT
jgi:membrane protein DedA with SNARE-associated domain